MLYDLAGFRIKNCAVSYAMDLKIFIPTMVILVWIVVLYFSMSTIEAKNVLLYKDPKQPVEARVNDLLQRMNLAEKIGQMTQLERENMTADIIKNYYIGSLLSGGGSWPRQNASAKDWVDMINEFQRGAMSTRLGIPFIYGIDAVHGHNVYKATIFPHNIGLGVTRYGN